MQFPACTGEAVSAEVHRKRAVRDPGPRPIQLTELPRSARPAFLTALPYDRLVDGSVRVQQGGRDLYTKEQHRRVPREHSQQRDDEDL